VTRAALALAGVPCATCDESGGANGARDGAGADLASVVDGAADLSALVDAAGVDQAVAADLGRPRDASAIPDDAKDGSSACTPGQSVCQGNLLAACGSSDLGDAQDCTAFAQATVGQPFGQTAANPFLCATAYCAIGDTACCRPTHPVCVWSQSAPFASSGTDYGFGATAVDTCGIAPSIPGVSLEFFVTKVGQHEVIFTVDLTSIAAGSTSLPGMGLRVTYSTNGEGGGECTLTGGAMTWSSPPSWSLTIDATAICPDPISDTPTSIAVTGSYSGTR
jgi:hypothetical protein